MSWVYVRSGVPGWTPEQQEAKLREAGLWLPSAICRDDLPHGEPRRPTPDMLVQRARMLDSISDTEDATIHVASLLCLALNPIDLGRVLASAAARNATVRTAESGLSIPPHPHAAVMAEALTAFETARREKQTEPGRSKGIEIAAERRRVDTVKKLAIARPLWLKPSSEISTPEIARQAELSVKTLYNHLGRRTTVQTATLGITAATDDGRSQRIRGRRG